jgi:hypothetical protein
VKCMLTTGLGLPCDQARLAACVDRLGGTGIAALSSGSGVCHLRVPSAVVETAEIR